MSDRYPKSSVVWPGAVLGYLVNAVMTAEYAVYASFAFWKGHDYVKNGHGLYGAIAFDKATKNADLVGVFFDPKSPRSPYQSEAYDLALFFRGMPPQHRPLEERALGYMHETVHDASIPCITTALWSEGERLAAADPWDVVLAEGARIVRVELIENTDEALAEWQKDYEMRREQVAFVRSLFERKMGQPEGLIHLTPGDIEWLRSTSKEPNENGIVACRKKLAAIGILSP